MDFMEASSLWRNGMILSRVKDARAENTLEARDCSFCQSWVKEERMECGRVMNDVFNLEEEWELS
jgi:hypothetical protein